MQKKKKIEIVFPDAPHTAEGQAKARRAHVRRIKRISDQVRVDLVKLYGKNHVRMVELAVKVACGHGTPEDAEELKRRVAQDMRSCKCRKRQRQKKGE